MMGGFHFFLFILVATVIVVAGAFYGTRLYNYIRQRGITQGEKVLIFFAFIAIVIALIARK